MATYHFIDSTVEIDGQRIPVIYNPGDSFIDVNGTRYAVSHNLCKEISVDQKVVHVCDVQREKYISFLLAIGDLIENGDLPADFKRA